MTGAGVSDAVRQRVIRHFRRRCAYCLAPVYLFPGTECIEHIIPRVASGSSEEDNLCLACCRCNLRKGSQVVRQDSVTERLVRLFHPRKQVWEQHFRWTHGYTRLEALTAEGRVTINALRLNELEFVEARRRWVKAGWHPPKD